MTNQGEISQHYSDVSIAVMAGGKSSRMGFDKSFVNILGKPMIEWVLAEVAKFGKEVIIITNETKRYQYLKLPIYQDIYPDCGPLGGLHSALYHATNRYVLVVACDMPWLNRSLIEHLLQLRESADVIVPRWHPHPEPLHAVYAKSCLPFIEIKLLERQLKTISFYEDVNVRYIERNEIAKYDKEGRSFKNVNSPEDLAAVIKAGNQQQD